MKCPNCNGKGYIKVKDEVPGWKWEPAIFFLFGVLPIPIMARTERTVYKVISVIRCANCEGSGAV